jgi:hypothetical protein
MAGTSTDIRGVVKVTYDEEASIFSNYLLEFPDDFTAITDAEWIIEQIEAGTFLLVSLVDRDEIQRRLG